MVIKTKGNRKVTIMQHRLLHYRVGFFEELRRKGRSIGIDIDVVHGQASIREASRKDEGVLAWASRVNNRYFYVKGKDLLWQPIPKEKKESDLIILMQENRILSNYPILLNPIRHRPMIAFWGHGANFQSASPNGLSERWKRWLAVRVDWWFAYTERTAEVLCAAGFDRSRITNLNNAIDTKLLKEQYDSVSSEELNYLRAHHFKELDPKVAVFCGSIYPDKRPELLVKAADLIKAEIPRFHMVIIGEGPSKHVFSRAAASRPWVHVVGQKREREKAVFYRVADVMLNPGLVGLHILDAFAVGLPLVTTRNVKHGPEISYLKDMINGILADDDPQNYADASITLLKDKRMYNRISEEARISAEQYSLENMTDNFLAGIDRCLCSAPSWIV